MTRQYTNHLLELVEQGVLSKDLLITACLKYMSESDVQDMAESNEFVQPNELEEND